MSEPIFIIISLSKAARNVESIAIEYRLSWKQDDAQGTPHSMSKYHNVMRRRNHQLHELFVQLTILYLAILHTYIVTLNTRL